MKLRITCIPGDGIGPEIVAQAKKVLDKVAAVYGHEMKYTDILMGGASIDVHGVPLTDKAIETAKGDYLAFLDSDDLWMPEKLEKQLNFMQENNFFICLGNLGC